MPSLATEPDNDRDDRDDNNSCCSCTANNNINGNGNANYNANEWRRRDEGEGENEVEGEGEGEVAADGDGDNPDLRRATQAWLRTRELYKLRSPPTNAHSPLPFPSTLRYVTFPQGTCTCTCTWAVVTFAPVRWRELEPERTCNMSDVAYN